MEEGRPRVIELFAGCGGATLGLHRAGWHHVVCVEREPAAAATLAAAGFPALLADVREVDWSAWRGTELMWASPPCQPGSAAGKRRGSTDDRDGWPWTFAAIDAVRPVWFLAENVLGWSYHEVGCPRDGERAGCVGCYWEGEILPAVAARYAFSGTWKLDAADYGVPQHRRRLIIWAGPLPLASAPPPATHGNADGLRPFVTVRDAIGATVLDDRACDRRRCYPCDGSHGRACLDPWRLDRPAPTVTTTEVKGTRAHAPEWTFNGGPDRASDALFLIAGIRRIEVEEGLVLQGVPADWPLQGTREEQYVQVGNAVPPALAEVAARAVALAHAVYVRLGQSPELESALRRSGLAVPTRRAA